MNTAEKAGVFLKIYSFDYLILENKRKGLQTIQTYSPYFRNRVSTETTVKNQLHIVIRIVIFTHVFIRVAIRVVIRVAIRVAIHIIVIHVGFKHVISSIVHY